MIRTKRIYVRNNKLYIDSYTEWGRVRVATGLQDTLQNRKDINARFDELVYKALRGDTRKSSTKLKDIINDFFSELQGVKDTTLSAYKSCAKQILKGLGNKDIRVFSAHNVGEWFSTRPRKFEVFFNRLIAYTNENNTDLNLKPIKIRRAKVVVDKEIQPFSFDEMKLILTELQNNINSRQNIVDIDLLHFLYIAFLTGARTGEILALNWEDIDFKNNKILITKSLTQSGKITTPKTRSSVRYIDMLEPLTEYLQKHRKDNGRIVQTKLNALRMQFYDLLNHLGLKMRVLYNTRHTFASLMLSNNEEPLWVCAMLGHKNLNITYSHYAKFIPQKKARANFLQGVL